MSQESEVITTLRRCGPLGFGTGPLQFGKNERASVRLLRTAIDLGVSYFDTAPMYGIGAIETLVGKAIAGRRNEIKLASKAGIRPNPRGLGKRFLDRSAVVLRTIRPLRAIVPAPEPNYPIFNVFDLRNLRASVEASLRALRTDRLDVLLLHECGPDVAADPEVTGFAESLKREGKIVVYGVAPTDEQILRIRQAGIRFGDIVQFANAVGDDNVTKLGIAADELAITHSCLGRMLRETVVRLKADADAASRWRSRLNVDPFNEDRIAQLFLARAVARNPAGLVLFSTNSENRLRANLLTRDAAFSSDQIDGLDQTVMQLQGYGDHARIDPAG